MTATAPRSLHDPLAAFMAGITGSKRPVPLVATSFSVTLDAGFAVVETVRRFHNAETQSIEATITFPLPVHAVLFSLQARIGDRLLTAKAQSRDGARQSYEMAVTRGRSAVLHEELLRGVHMLSVAHVPPGADIEVKTLWATTLTLAGDGATLRIPLTVGDIYGRSGLLESDELVHGGGTADRADLSVHGAAGVELVGGLLADGRARVPLNAPIDLRIPRWTPRSLVGRAADGRAVALRVEPGEDSEQAVDVAILVDRSGSMNELCAGETDGGSADGAADRPTKHEAVVDGVVALAGLIGEGDTVELWEFAGALSPVGSTRDGLPASRASGAVHRTPQARLTALAGRLTMPQGGTEIGQALAGVMQRSTMRDLLLVTDGKSHALSVQDLAAGGRRITVVLVGEDSLEANVGHLAALSGGDIFVASGAEVRDVLEAALATLRRPHERPVATAGAAQRARALRGGARVSATWRPAAAPVGNPVVENPVLARAIAAFAAALALPGLASRAATELAVAEGLVSHLTSLVLVDEEGTVQEGIPAVRKVELPMPRTVSSPPMFPMDRWAAAPSRPGASAGFDSLAVRALFRRRAPAPPGAAATGSARAPAAGPGSVVDLSALVAAIDWDRAPNDLLAGDLSQLDRRSVRLIKAAAAVPDLTALARSLGVSPVILVIGLLADARANRSAARIAAAVLGKLAPPDIRRAKRLIGLAP